MKIQSKPFFFIGAICFIVAFFLTCLDISSFNRDFYKKEYAQLNTAAEIGMSEADLTHTTEVLLDYIQNKRADLDVMATISGVDRAVFNEKEILHMVDVKNLYLDAMMVRNFSWVGFIVMIVIGIMISKKDSIFALSDMFLKAIVSTLSVLTLLGIYALVDFNSFWLQFHYIFFTNDLFFLDPNTDILIQMVPSQFFFDLVFKIVSTFGIGILLVCLVSIYFRRKKA